mmetsp:Transcript_3099/g.6428  ORF Transcript_3099/g.6428 Transcript_3099/m.6428 type:complete len:182 (-) Transcript_3099:355-900(-)
MKSKTQRVTTASDRQPIPSQLPLIIGKASFDTHELYRQRISTALSSSQKRDLQHSFDNTMPIVSLRQKTIEAGIKDLESELRHQRSLNRHLRKAQRDLSMSTTFIGTARDESYMQTEAAEINEELTEQVSTAHASIRELLGYCNELEAECQGMYDNLREQELLIPDKQGDVDRVTLNVVGI